MFKTLRAVTPHMIEQGYGRIVATSSMGGHTGIPNLSHYVAAKWGVIGLVKTLALELARHGITVNAVCPGSVDTPMVHNEAFYGLFAPDVEHPTRETVESRYASITPMAGAVGGTGGHRARRAVPGVGAGAVRHGTRSTSAPAVRH